MALIGPLDSYVWKGKTPPVRVEWVGLVWIITDQSGVNWCGGPEGTTLFASERDAQTVLDRFLREMRRADMKKFIIIWNIGYGDNAEVIAEVIEAEDQTAADNAAYEVWREDAESHAEYQAHPYTADLASAHGLIDEDEEKS